MIEGIIGGLIVVIGIVAVIAIITIFRAFVLCKLWAWFIVPFFHLPELTIPFAIGITLVIGMFHSHIPQKDDSKTQFWTITFASPLLALLFGWIVKMFI